MIGSRCPAWNRIFGKVLWGLHRARYYREQARLARRLAGMVHQTDLRKTLDGLARDLDEIAEDLETGAVEVRHPELMPQRARR